MTTRKILAGAYSIGGDHWPGLAKAAEECGEVVQVTQKIIAAGGDPAHWDGSDLRQRLEDEIADVRAALIFLIEQNGLNADRILRRMNAKLILFGQWHREQRDEGAAGGPRT